MSSTYSRMLEDNLLKDDFQQGIGLSSETNFKHTDDFTAQTDVDDLSSTLTGCLSNPEALRTADRSSALNPLASIFTPLNNSNRLSPDSPSMSNDNRSKNEPEKACRSDASKRGKAPLPNSSCLDVPRLESKTGFIDTHCHLDYLFERQNYHGTHAAYMRRHRDTYPVNYEGCVTVFCDPFTFLQEEMWQKYLTEESVWGAFGCHPHNAKFYDDSIETALCNVLLHSKVRALGEIGLDYSKRNGCPKQTQKEVMRRQLNIAKMLSLPIVIHCRDANDDCMEMMKETLPRESTIHLHCFTGSWSQAQHWLSEFPNLFIGMTNLVTYDSARATHEVAKRIKLNRLLLETDAPYFVPRKMRTRWSHPGMAIHVAHQIAALRKIPLEEVLYWTRRNTNQMYGI